MEQKSKVINNKISDNLKLILLISIILTLFLGSTYAFILLNATNTNATGQGGCFQVSYTGQNLNAGTINTTTDYTKGAHTTVTLSKDNTCKIYTEASIYLHTNNTTTAPVETISALKYKVLNGSTTITTGTITSLDDFLLITVPLTNTATTYTIYLWIDSSISNGEYDNKNYSGYIYAETAQTSTIK